MQDKVKPNGAWEFDKEVTDCFDDMLKRSIPDYKNMRELCEKVGRRFVNRENSNVVDLGASRGNAVEPYVRMGDGVYCMAVESSPPMREALNRRFFNDLNFCLLENNLKDEYQNISVNLTLAILTLQFVPINYRQKIIDDVYRTTRKGGAFIIVEKVLGDSSEVDKIMVDIYHDYKRDVGGYSNEDVERKKQSLEGVLVPVTSKWNRDMLKNAGFDCVDVFWRSMNFCAFVAIKR